MWTKPENGAAKPRVPGTFAGGPSWGPGRAPAPADPGVCAHGNFVRLGVQEIAEAPFRVHLVACGLCGTSIATESLRVLREGR
jgi:hypothetical protein